MGVFKEDSKICVSKIVNLWVAEGFLRPNKTHNLEDVGEGYLKELIDRNLILVSRHRHNGTIGSCGIHDLLRDLCVKVAKQQEFFHMSEDEFRGTERRLIYCDRQHQLHYNGDHLARSVMAWSTLKQPVNHKLLRVGDAGRLETPTEIYGNVNLRYIAYSRWSIVPTKWELPTSVSLIWNLQTLIIKQRTLVVAPIEIWKMRQLRHVKCDRIYVPDRPPHPSDDLFVMDKLRTLKTTMNLRVSEEVCKFIPTIKKLYLRYQRHLRGYDDSVIERLCNLDCMHKLESLKLSFGEGLRPEVNKIVKFPVSLNKLSLIGCRLEWEDVSMIGSLPQLEVLQLISNSSEREEWSPIDGQFLRLKYLKIDCCDLFYWDADKSHFPVLEKLALCNLWHLKEIPLGMGEIPTLQLIIVDCCNESTAISAVRIKEDEVENEGYDALLQIQLGMPDYKLKSFEERLKTEGLTLNNVQLVMD